MGKFISRRDDGDTKLAHETNVVKAAERAMLMSTGELITWVESVSSTLAVQLGSYAAHQGDSSQLYEARQQTEVLHGLLTVLISRP